VNRRNELRPGKAAIRQLTDRTPKLRQHAEFPISIFEFRFSAFVLSWHLTPLLRPEFPVSIFEFRSPTFVLSWHLTPDT